MNPSPPCGFVPVDVNRPALHYHGNPDLLDRPAIAFLCSTRCPGYKILEAYEWARRQCDEASTVISGFHMPVEKVTPLTSNAPWPKPNYPNARITKRRIASSSKHEGKWPPLK